MGLLPQNIAHFEDALVRFLDSQGRELIKFAHMWWPSLVERFHYDKSGILE